MEEPRWIDAETLYMIHAQQIERFGGSPGVLDRGVEESALNRPLHRYHYGGTGVDLADLAAAYLYGFAQSQGFVDGNKRIGLASALVFLSINGKRLHVPPEDLFRLTLAVADEKVRTTEAAAAAWFRERI